MDDPQKKAIIVVDMLVGFCRRGNLACERLDRVTAPIVTYLERERAAGAELIFLVDTHVPDDAEFAIFPPHCVEGSGEDELVPELRELAAHGLVVRKRRYSGFYDTELEALLAEIAPAVVEVVGVCTDICVLHTVADLRNRDIPVVVWAGMVETYDAPGHDGDEANAFALAHLRDILGARVE